RRHTRFSRDWSSDVCSSDLRECRGICAINPIFTTRIYANHHPITHTTHAAPQHQPSSHLSPAGSSAVTGSLTTTACQDRHPQIQIGRASCRERVKNLECSVS